MINRNRKIITFLSDFGTADGYAGSVKGVLKRIAPSADIIDISHELPPFNIAAGAFAVLNYYRQYPSGTVHLVVVDPGVGGQRTPVILQTGDYFFVGPDNGVFHFVEARESCQKYRILTEKVAGGTDSFTFHGRDIFAPAAAFLAGGGEIQNIAEPMKGEKLVQGFRKNLIQFKGNRLQISALAIDHFGNIVSALAKKDFAPYRHRLRFIEIKNKTIPQINAYYELQPAGTLMALWNSLDLLEIAVNQGSAAEQLQFDLNRDKVYIYLS